MDLKERFLKYVSYDTQSSEESTTFPSTEKQKVLLAALRDEMEALGMTEVSMDQYGYVMGTVPATPGCENAPVIGFIAHVDTSPDMSGKDVKPRVIEEYDGCDIALNGQLTMRVADFPELEFFKGHTLIHTDGTTLLGADDKAGIAEILTVVETLQQKGLPHGRLCVAFTPDEEIGRGADRFDVKDFGAAVAYTVDGGPIGEIEYENFNAASGKVRIQGASIHPGDAKLKMKNAILIGMEFQSLLPVFENPMYTEGYEGFYHLDEMSGNVEEAQLNYIIRDHDHEKFEQKKKFFAEAADFLNRKYGKGTVIAEVTDSYYNMKEKIEPCMYLIDTAKEAMTACGIEPEVVPIRGGTDGARLSYMGLPCSNLCTGGYNYHGKYEFIPVASLEKTSRVLVEIGKKFAVIRSSVE